MGNWALVKERRLTDWRLRVEDLAAEIEREAEDLENMDAQSILEGMVETLGQMSTDMNDFCEEYCP